MESCGANLNPAPSKGSRRAALGEGVLGVGSCLLGKGGAGRGLLGQRAGRFLLDARLGGKISVQL